MPKFLFTHWGTYEVVEDKNSKISLKLMTLVGIFFLIVSIPSSILAMKLEKKFKQRKI